MVRHEVAGRTTLTAERGHNANADDQLVDAAKSAADALTGQQSAL